MSVSDGLLPIVPYLVSGQDGDFYLQGVRCDSCQQITVGVCNVCPACGERGAMREIRLKNTGKLYNYTIVYRSNPGVRTPFVSEIVDLDGGGTVKGNLASEPENVRFDMPVKLAFEKLKEIDAKGRHYYGYYFTQN